MLTLDNLQWRRTRVRLANGTETIVVRHRSTDSVRDYLELGRIIRVEADWLAGKLSDAEACAQGLDTKWMDKLRATPDRADSQDEMLAYWATLQPDDILLETTSINHPIIRLQDIVAINNTAYLHKGWESVEPPPMKEEPTREQSSA